MLKDITGKMGKFWLPDDDTCFNGILEKENGNFVFKTSEKNFEAFEQDYILINGMVENSEMTLIFFKIMSEVTFAEVSNMNYSILYLFEGFFKSIDEISFDNVVLDIDNISSVIDLDSLTENIDEENNQFSVSYSLDSFSFDLNDFNLKIFKKLYTSSKRLGNGNYIALNEKILLKLSYFENVNIKKLNHDIRIIRDFFSFLTGKSHVIDIYRTENKHDKSIFLPLLDDDSNCERNFYTYISITKNNAENMVKSWWDNYNNLFDVYYSYFTAIESSDVITSFLTFSRILESYHRHRYEGLYVSSEDFERVSDDFINCATKVEYLDSIVSKDNKSNYLNKLRGSIEHCNEFTFADRLKELFEGLLNLNLFKEILEKFSNGSDLNPSLNNLKKIIKTNRNYYTHYGVKEVGVYNEIDLLELRDALKFIIELIFFKELGYSYEEINEITSKNNRFKLNQYYTL